MPAEAERRRGRAFRSWDSRTPSTEGWASFSSDPSSINTSSPRPPARSTSRAARSGPSTTSSRTARVSNLNIGYARMVRDGTSIGVTLGRYSGSMVRTLTRSFDEATEIEDYVERGKWSYTGHSITAGVGFGRHRRRAGSRPACRSRPRSPPTRPEGTNGADGSFDLPIQYRVGRQRAARSGSGRHHERGARELVLDRGRPARGGVGGFGERLRRGRRAHPRARARQGGAAALRLPQDRASRSPSRTRVPPSGSSRVASASRSTRRRTSCWRVPTWRWSVADARPAV